MRILVDRLAHPSLRKNFPGMSQTPLHPAMGGTSVGEISPASPPPHALATDCSLVNRELHSRPNEFIDCVGHVRLLSWLLVGALLHHGAAADSQPVPLTASQAIADHIQFVLAGFAEQSKLSVLHMSALFHGFHLCQVRLPNNCCSTVLSSSLH